MNGRLISIIRASRPLLLLLLFFLFQSTIEAQTLKGRVVDAVSGEAIPYASVSLLDLHHGVSSDVEGRFVLVLSAEASRRQEVKLRISSVGYEHLEHVWRRGSNPRLGILMMREVHNELATLVITPKKERYRRKNNPAVMLMERVISAKDSNQIKAFEDYSYREYEQILISQLGTTPGTKYFGLRAEVADRFRDSSLLTPSHIMPLSLREKQTIFAARSGSRLDPVITGRRLYGIEAGIDEGTLSNGLEGLLGDFDVYDNNLELLLTHFPSPLNRQWATHFYKYYIQDTVSYEGSPCFLMHFRPMNPRSTGLNGYIWIDTLQLSMRHVEMTLPPASNVNWVEKMKISTSFAPVESPRGIVWLPSKKSIGLVLKPTGLIQQGLEVELERDYHNYLFGEEALLEACLDPRSTLPEAEREQAMLPRPGSYGLVERPLPLSSRAQRAVDFVAYLQGHRGFNALSSLGRVMATGFLSLPLKPLERERILFDLGPYETLLGYNALEGARLRLGGMTTASLMQHLFVEGYAGYGLRDEQWKYYLRATYTPLQRDYHANEHPRHHLSVVAMRDLFVPGIEEPHLFKDGFKDQLGNFNNKVRFYGDKYQINYTRDWSDQFSTSLSAEYIRKTATGDLAYYRLDEELRPQLTPYIEQTSIELDTRFTVGGAKFRRVRPEGSLDVTRYRPSMGLSLKLYPKGLPGNRTTYAHLETHYSQRLYLSVLGRMDVELDAGLILGQAPQTSAFSPRGNLGWILRRSTFQTLRPLEYIADRYLRFQASYHLNGLLLSRLPLIKHLDLREVMGLHGYWGHLSAQARTPRAGMEYLYQAARPMDKQLHLEASLGIENIFNILRIDYVYRLTDRALDTPYRSVIRLQTKITF